MGKELKPLTVLLVLVFFGGLLGAKFWAGGKALDVPRLTHLARHPDGRIFALAGDRLIAWREPDGPAEQLPLERFGAPTAVGDLAFFSNGDLLLRRGPYQPGLLDNLFRFARVTSPGPETSSVSDLGLARCRLDSGDCQAFGDTRYRLDNAFHLAVEPGTDRVVLADTDRHRLILLDSDGAEIDRLEGEFRFPNHVLFHSGELFVADTNHHRIARVEIGESGFGAVATLLRTDPLEARVQQRTWPSAMLAVGSQWWVVNNNNDMGRGVIHRFDADGALLGRVNLANDADPLCLLADATHILISDYQGQRIVRLDADGVSLGELESPGMAELLAGRRAEQARFEGIDEAFTWAFGVFLVLGFLYAILDAIRSRPASRPLREPPPAEPEDLSIRADDPRIEWLPLSPLGRRLRWAMPLLYLALIVTLGLLTALVGQLPTRLLWLESLLLLVTLLPIAYTLLMLRSRIGALDDRIVAQSWRGRFASARGERTIHAKMGFILDGIVIIHTTRAGKPLYDRSLLESRLLPLLAQGQEVGLVRFEGLTYRHEPAALAMVVLMILIVIVGVTLRVNS